jgi:hypothetical protein
MKAMLMRIVLFKHAVGILAVCEQKLPSTIFGPQNVAAVNLQQVANGHVQKSTAAILGGYEA